MYRDGILYVCDAVHIYVYYIEYIQTNNHLYKQDCLLLNKNQSLFLKTLKF